MRRKRMGSWLLGAALLASMSMAHAELASGYQVVLMTENFPPFSMAVGEKNFARADEVKGINTDVVREMFKRAGIDYNLSLRFPWDRIYKTTLDTPDDALFSVTMNEARRPLFKWVGPLSSTQRVFVAKADSTIHLANLDDARKYRIGSYQNSSTSAFLDKNTMVYVASLRDQENAKKLLDGSIDLWATQDPVFRYFADQEGIKGLKVVFVAEAGTEQYLALNLQTPDEVVERLQKALDQMRSDGTLAQLALPYLGDH